MKCILKSYALFPKSIEMVKCDFDNMDLACNAHTVPSRSLFDDIQETIERSIHRQIAKAQMEFYEVTNAVYLHRVPRAAEHYMRAGMPKEDALNKAFIKGQEFEKIKRKEMEQTIEGLYVLLEYRVQEAEEWCSAREVEDSEFSM